MHLPTASFENMTRRDSIKNIREIKELTPHLAEKPATARNSKDIHGLIDVRRITMVKNDLAALNREVN